MVNEENVSRILGTYQDFRPRLNFLRWNTELQTNPSNPDMYPLFWTPSKEGFFCATAMNLKSIVSNCINKE